MKTGRYLHYKGNIYIVLGTVKHSETEEELVLYRSEKNEQLWVRPFNMFNEMINLDGQNINRFKYIGE